MFFGVVSSFKCFVLYLELKKSSQHYTCTVHFVNLINITVEQRPREAYKAYRELGEDEKRQGLPFFHPTPPPPSPFRIPSLPRPLYTQARKGLPVSRKTSGLCMVENYVTTSNRPFHKATRFDCV